MSTPSGRPARGKRPMGGGAPRAGGSGRGQGAPRRGGSAGRSEERGRGERAGERRGTWRPETRRSSGQADERGGTSRPDERRGSAQSDDRRGGGVPRKNPASRAGKPVRQRAVGGPEKKVPYRKPAPTAAQKARASRPRPDIDVHDPNGVRLQKLLASAGIGSRRACEELIAQGRVEVDGVVVTELGVRIDPATQAVHVDGERVVLDDSRVYLAFNKPVGVVTTMADEQNRPSIFDYVGKRKERLFHVGRLDQDTEGLLILTNDGDLAHRLQHPQYHVQKTYVALVEGNIPRDLGRRLKEGVNLDDGPAKADDFRLLASEQGRSLVEIVIHEGRKHIVRRMLAEAGHPVLELNRVQVGPVRLGELKPGKMRPLTSVEIAALYSSAGM